MAICPDSWGDKTKPIKANRRAQLKAEGKMPSTLAGGTPTTQNKGNFVSRRSYCVCRVLKEQSQFFLYFSSVFVDIILMHNELLFDKVVLAPLLYR